MISPGSNPLRVAFLVNGGVASAMGERARAFAAVLADRCQIEIFYRDGGKLRAILRFRREVRRVRPEVVYVFDMAFSGVLAAALCRQGGCPVIIDTGDAIYELSKSIGRGLPGRILTWALERFSLRLADALVVRGSFHRELLADRGFPATFIPDGVDPAQFQATPDAENLRRELGLENCLVLGLIGSSVWSERLGICYGWELVEVLRLLKEKPVKGLFVGDGSGVEHLRAACREHGVEEKIVFLGRQPYERLPALLGAMDVCLSTQTNDVPGQVRTTGKLPLYLAAGKHVLATRVGEAARILPGAMLVDYHGTVDRAYPERLAARVGEILSGSEALAQPEELRALAREHFDYRMLGERMHRLLVGVARKHGQRGGAA